MVKFFAKRVGVLFFTMLVVSFLVFVTFEFSSGDVAVSALGQFATKDQLLKYHEENGLDRPFLDRYLAWLGVVPDHKNKYSGLLEGDFGYSHLWRTQVNTFIWDRLRNTTMLALIAFAIIAPLSIVLGVVAGMREGSAVDRVISVFSTITTSVPEFATGVVLMTIFAAGIIMPVMLPGTSTLDTGGDWSIVSQLVLPIATLTTYYLGYLVRMVRASMVEVMTRPYVRTAILKGLSFPEVVVKHAMRNALITPFTAILLQLNFLFTSVVVTEAVFAFPGFGRMIVDAALYKDVATVETATLFAVFVVVTSQIIGDFTYMLLNPRIRFS
jgi:peptide/nickel transport system permease protein